MTIKVSPEKLAEIEAKYAAFDIAEKGRIKKTFFVQNVEYVSTGGIYEGFEGCKVQDTKLYKGDLVPTSYDKLRGQSYTSLSVYCGNRTLILLEKVTFICSEEKAEQLNLF